MGVGIHPSGLTANGSRLQQPDVEEELVISKRSQQGRTLTMNCPQMMGLVDNPVLAEWPLWIHEHHDQGRGVSFPRPSNFGTTSSKQLL